MSISLHSDGGKQICGQKNKKKKTFRKKKIALEIFPLQSQKIIIIIIIIIITTPDCWMMF